VRAFLEDMLRRGELKTVNEILMKYASCVGLEAPEARRTTAIGLSDLGELYGSGDGSALMEAIRAWATSWPSSVSRNCRHWSALRLCA